MKVNEVLRLSSIMLQLYDIEDVLKHTNILVDVDNTDLKLLLSCINLACNTIATDYINLVEKKEVVCDDGFVPFQSISDNQIYKILSVKDSFGHKIPFRISSNGIEIESGRVQIVYSYFPAEVNYNDDVANFAGLTERVLAYGVASEYLFIKGNFDDAAIWDDRFKNALRALVRTKHEVVMPKRRWW